jgi:hypothetical protein
MTLAFLVLLSFVVAPPTGLRAQDTQAQPSQASQESQSPAAEIPSGSKSSSEQPKTKSSVHQKKKSKRHHQTGKKADAPCVAPSGSSASEMSSPQSTGTDPAGQSANQAHGTVAAKDCPPPKIVVRRGGTEEPAIQLAGGPTADQAADKRNAVNQLLEVTGENLKKTAAMQLSSAQQDTITQTRQFVEQSKTAMANGDFERARTLAWKAQLLSEDLVNPEK